MRGAVSVLGTVKSLKWRLVFTKDQYSAHCSLCLKPYHKSSALGSPGKISMLMTLLSSLNHLRNVPGCSWHGKSNGEKRTESKCRKDKDYDLWYGTGPPAEFRRVSNLCAVCRTGVGSNSIFCNGCKHWVHKKCNGLKCFFFFFFLIWVLRPFQEYFTFIEPIVHRRWAKTGEPGEKPPDHP